jgi:hypothetical protein
MSCADVCLDMDHDGNEFYTEAMRTARKPHRCCECQRTIQPGERYEHAAGKGHGDRVFTAKTCAECSAIRDALVCGSWVFEQLWEAIEESVFPTWIHTGPWDCLAKIESVDARKALSDAFYAWKAEHA